MEASGEKSEVSIKNSERVDKQGERTYNHPIKRKEKQSDAPEPLEQHDDGDAHVPHVHDVPCAEECFTRRNAICLND